MATNKAPRATYRPIEKYLSLPYTIEVIKDIGENDVVVWFAQVKELPGCMTEVDTFSEVQDMIADAMRVWIEAAMEDGEAIPEPKREEEYSGKFVTRVPPSLHRAVVTAAEEESVSLNLWVATQLARAVGHPPPKGRAIRASSAPAQEMPAPPWPRLSAAAWQALCAVDADTEAKDIDERLFANWLEQKLLQAQKALEIGHFRDAQTALAMADQALQLCATASPLMSTFHRAVQFLTLQVQWFVQSQKGDIGLSTVTTRARVQVEQRFQQQLSVLKEGAIEADTSGLFGRTVRVMPTTSPASHE